MDYSQLNVERDKDIIIPRALYFTNINSFSDDISRLEILYAPRQIVQQLRNTKEMISNKVCAMVAERYHIPPFRRFQLPHLYCFANCNVLMALPLLILAI